MDNEIDTWSKDDIICPYCGDHSSGHDYLIEGVAEGNETCFKCKKVFYWCADFEVSFTTNKKNDNQSS